MGLKSSQGYLAKPAPGLGYLPEGREPSVNLHKPDLHRAVSTLYSHTPMHVHARAHTHTHTHTQYLAKIL